MPDSSSSDRLDQHNAPSELETLRAHVAGYRDMDTQARIDALTSIQRTMDALLAGRTPIRTREDADFWRWWVDPLYVRTG